MKVSIECNSLLLKQSLEIFLKEYLSTYKKSDLVICDRKIQTDKPLVVVGSMDDADIKIPFSRSSLLEELKKIYDNIYFSKESDCDTKKSSPKELWKLERMIDKLTIEFREKLIKTIREFYEE